MASNTMSGMDEFFDFDQLEHDHGTQLPTVFGVRNDGPFCDPGDVMAMDWTTSASAPSPVECHMQSAFDSFAIQDQAQWPLADALPQNLFEGVSIVDPVSTSHDADADVAIAPASSDISPIAGAAPSSSFSSLHVSSVPSCADVGMIDPCVPEFTPPFAVQVADSDTPELPAVTSNNNHSKARPNVPLRQPSAASWKPASAKRKGPQSRIPFEAKQILEDEFNSNPYPCSWEMDIIAHQANLDVKKVRNWFNNTRARKKGGGMFYSLMLCIVLVNPF